MKKGTAALLAAALLLLVLAVIALVGYARQVRHAVEFGEVWTPRRLLSEAYEDLNTGDVLLFVASSGLPTNSLFLGTYYTHAAVVLRRKGVAYVSEAHRGVPLMPGQGPASRAPPGANVTPLLPRLRYYTGLVYHLRLEPGLPPAEAEALEARALAARGNEYPTAAGVLRGLLGLPTRARHCFQHVAWLLEGAGLEPEGGLNAGLFEVGRRVCSLPGRPLRRGGQYAAPVQLLYDVGLRRDPRRVRFEK